MEKGDKNFANFWDKPLPDLLQQLQTTHLKAVLADLY